MRDRTSGVLFSILAVTGLLLVPGDVLVAGTPEPSETCGSCHRDIYRMWRDSAHAQALDDPFFLEHLGNVDARYGKGRARECVRCHAPMASVVGDHELSRAITREGVNCEFCHGLVAVSIGDNGPTHKLEIGPVKHGTIPGADSRGHDVAYSELHGDSLICAPCHEYVNERGTPIMTTYSEWQNSSAAERNESCQNCHMNLVDSDVVDPRIKRESGAKVNLHEMPGGHSLQQLHKALKVQLGAERVEHGLEVSARIRNEGAGHAVPTGMPGRRIILKVDVRTSGGQSFHDVRVYEKRFVVGEQSQRVDNVADLFFADGLRLAADTRIQPDEDRRETFSFPIPEGETAWVDLRLQYEHAPWGEGQERVWITFFSESRLVRRVS